MGTSVAPRTARAVEAATAQVEGAGSRAVRSLGVALDAPFYTYDARTQGGWSDTPRRTFNSVGAALAGVAPVGERFGFRLALGGQVDRYVIEDADSIVVDRGHLGELDLASSFFWRAPDRGSLGLAYEVFFGFAPDADETWVENELAIDGALFLGDFDLAARLGYEFGRPTYLVYSSSVGPDPFTAELRLNGVALAGGSTWYAADGLSMALGGGFEYRNEAWPDGVWFADATKLTEGRLEMTARWLPPVAARRWILLEGRLVWARVISGYSGDPFARRSNRYEVGAVLRFVFPGVPSLKMLAREY